MNKMIPLIMLLGLWSFSVVSAEPVQVIAEGKAPGDIASAREQALTDALRDAVQKGAGVDVISSSKVTDFVLDYDRVLAASFGFVKTYTVLEGGLGDDGLYRVKIRATVDKGQPGVQDKMALQLIVRAKGSPRVALEIDELIEGIPGASGFCQTWFEQAARDMQMNLVDVKRVGRQDDRLAARDQFFGDQKTADLRRLGVAQQADFIIQAKVRGRSVGTDDVYGMKAGKYAFSVDLRAIRPDTGVILVSIPVPSFEGLSALESRNEGAREVLFKLLDGGQAQTKDGAWPLFRRVFANWIAELDLGAIMRLEFKQISDSEFDRIHKALGGTPKITSVWPREFDSKGLSFMDVESRLDASAMKAAVIEGLGGAFAIDHTTRNYLQFVRAAASGVSNTRPSVTAGQGDRPVTRNSQNEAGGAEVGKTEESPAVSPPPSTINPQPSSSSLPPWAWALIGAGVVAVLVGVFMLGKKSSGWQGR